MAKKHKKSKVTKEILVADIEKAMNLGATDYIIKSNISLKDLVMKVKEHLPVQ